MKETIENFIYGVSREENIEDIWRVHDKKRKKEKDSQKKSWHNHADRLYIIFTTRHNLKTFIIFYLILDFARLNI